MDKSGVVGGSLETPTVGAFTRVLDSDVFYSFRRSPLVIVAAAIVLAYILAALFAPWKRSAAISGPSIPPISKGSTLRLATTRTC